MIGDVNQCAQFVVIEDWTFNNNLTARRRLRIEQVSFGSKRSTHSSHEFFTNGIKRRVRDLCKELSEIVEQQTRTRGQHSDRSIGAH